MTRYVVTLVVLVLIMVRSGKSRFPSALGQPYNRE